MTGGGSLIRALDKLGAETVPIHVDGPLTCAVRGAGRIRRPAALSERTAGSGLLRGEAGGRARSSGGFRPHAGRAFSSCRRAIRRRFAGAAGTALRPFFAVQREIVEGALSVDVRSCGRGTIGGVTAAQATLAVGCVRCSGFEPGRPGKSAEVMARRAVPSASLDVGSADGVEVKSGLDSSASSGRSTSVAGDRLTHPDCASAMTGWAVYGLVGAARPAPEGPARLTGAPFHSDIKPGTRIVTWAGRHLPRGIPLGSVVGIEEADTGWRKSYLVRPAVRPEAAMHVLVGIRRDRGGEGDLSNLWPVGGAPDTADAAVGEGADGDQP